MDAKTKDLLIKDLCPRLPYGVMGANKDGVISPLLQKGEAEWGIITSINYAIEKYGWRPYLRPMTSMTSEEEVAFYTKIGCEIYDYLSAHHFDYRALIEKGLALEAPDGMYSAS